MKTYTINLTEQQLEILKTAVVTLNKSLVLSDNDACDLYPSSADESRMLELMLDEVNDSELLYGFAL